MFNEAVFLGRFVKGPELRSKEKGEGTVSWARFRIAVNRNYPKEEEADFFTCVAYDQKARYLARYGKAGGRVLVRGRLQSGQYEKDGRKYPSVELVVSECQVIDYKKEKTGKGEGNAPDGMDGSWDTYGEEQVPFPEGEPYPDYSPAGDFPYS